MVCLVSAVVYCGDDEARCAQTLASIARQTLRGLHVLLVVHADAESTAREAAWNVCGTTALEIGVLALEAPVSTHGRNQAIGLTLGKYICELPAGATIEPTMLEKCAWALETHPHAGLVVVNAATASEPTANLGRAERKGSPVGAIAPGGYVYRKRAWERCHGLDESAPSEAVDHDFCLRMVERNWAVVAVREILADLRHESAVGLGTVTPARSETAMVWLRSHHCLTYTRATVGRGFGRLHTRARRRLPVLGGLERRVALKLIADELTNPRLMLRHPLDSLLRLLPQRFKGARWARWGLPRRPNAWIDVPPLLTLPGPTGMEPAAEVNASPDHRTRVLLIHSQLIPGGAETVLLNLVTFIDHRRFDLHIITTDSLPGQPLANPWALRFAEQTAGIYHLPSFLDPSWYLRFVVDFINSRKIDVVVISLSRFAYNSVAQIRFACPTAAIVDLLHAEAPYYPMDHIRLAKNHRQYLDRRVVVSDTLRSLQVSKYGETPERMVVIRNGVDTEGIFNPTLYQRGPFRRSLGLRDDVAIVLWFGRMVIEKQPMHILETAERLRQRPDIVFVLLGDGPDKPAFERAVAERQLKNVIARPARDHIEEAVADADLVLFPSKREGLPMSGVEAMAMAKPVVAARVPGWNELISDGIDGFLIADGDIDGYADAVVRLVDEPALKARMGAAGRRKAVSAYDVRGFARAWEQLLREPRIGD